MRKRKKERRKREKEREVRLEALAYIAARVKSRDVSFAAAREEYEEQFGPVDLPGYLQPPRTIRESLFPDVEPTFRGNLRDLPPELRSTKVHLEEDQADSVHEDSAAVASLSVRMERESRGRLQSPVLRRALLMGPVPDTVGVDYAEPGTERTVYLAVSGDGEVLGSYSTEEEAVEQMRVLLAREGSEESSEDSKDVSRFDVIDIEEDRSSGGHEKKESD